MLANAIVVNILQYISVSNQHNMHLKLTQVYVDYISINLKENQIDDYMCNWN